VTDAPGVIFLEIDGLAFPVLQLAMRSGNAPTMARWLADGTHRLTEWETDLSSQTGASQAGILLGSNEDIPAFRWVEKETGRLMTCSAPADCAEIERRHATKRGLLIDGGASRGNLLSGEAAEVILTVSRMEEEKRANPGYRAFLANGFNVTRALVLFAWDVVIEWTAAARSKRRGVRPYAARPYELVVLSDHGQTQGATFKQRNGYGLDELVSRLIAAADVSHVESGDENDRVVGHAVREATGEEQARPAPGQTIAD